MGIRLRINGNDRDFDDLEPGSPVSALVAALGFRPDRVALERNGDIVPRAQWAATALDADDRLEVVHFVGGGCPVRWVRPHGG